jgi:hypothetical protein|tara:strand:+ start:1341 stop:1595 length:255 start_codon:yes stop_codon:yes gene_type:complete
MIQWMIRRLIGIMGRAYVFLDRFLKHEVTPVLGVEIDEDLQGMTRRQLCRHIEKKFGWDEDAFWYLESTQKIRLCCQVARERMK